MVSVRPSSTNESQHVQGDPSATLVLVSSSPPSDDVFMGAENESGAGDCGIKCLGSIERRRCRQLSNMINRKEH